jgi:hypothetical protein
MTYTDDISKSWRHAAHTGDYAKTGIRQSVIGPRKTVTLSPSSKHIGLVTKERNLQ